MLYICSNFHLTWNKIPSAFQRLYLKNKYRINFQFFSVLLCSHLPESPPDSEPYSPPETKPTLNMLQHHPHHPGGQHLSGVHQQNPPSSHHMNPQHQSGIMSVSAGVPQQMTHQLSNYLNGEAPRLSHLPTTEAQQGGTLQHQER